jgi:hypothetical protein
MTQQNNEIERLRDQLRLARQCIEACREQFAYLDNFTKKHGYCVLDDATTTSTIMMAKHCTTALSNLPAFDVSAEAKNIDEVIKKVSE